MQVGTSKPNTEVVWADFARELERENTRLRAVLSEIAAASRFDNIGNWARNKAKAALANNEITNSDPTET